jgi:hypothetical protein
MGLGIFIEPTTREKIDDMRGVAGAVVKTLLFFTIAAGTAVIACWLYMFLGQF